MYRVTVVIGKREYWIKSKRALAEFRKIYHDKWGEYPDPQQLLQAVESVERDMKLRQLILDTL